ncbi:MAG: cell division protein FtsX [Maritimibacter sp.]|nr:cell division protein FtsX [Maritimibacter sp.]
MALIAGDRQADRVVPPTGFTAKLTIFAAAAMGFLAVFALALMLATGRIADSWSDALAQSATVRVSAPDGQVETQVAAVMAVLRTTPGIAEAQVLSDDDQRALLEPWFGPDLPLDALPVPKLIAITETPEGYDSAGLRARLAGEAPGAVLDDHARWRAPLVAAAERIRLFGLAALVLIAATTAVIITLAAAAALAANAQVIDVLRLVGARDSYIARAFVRRYTLRALAGAAAGTAAGMIAVALMPSGDPAGGFLTGLGFAGLDWLWPLAIPPLAAVTAFLATRRAAFSTLRERP